MTKVITNEDKFLKEVWKIFFGDFDKEEIKKWNVKSHILLEIIEKIMSAFRKYAGKN